MALVLSALALSLILGAMSQRICGMGLGLIAVPVFVFFTGPVLGVMTVNIAAFLTGIVVAWSLRADINWHRWRIIAVWAIVGSLPGALVVKLLPAAPLSLCIGLALVAALATSVMVGSATPRIPKQALGATGFLGGFFNTAVGQAAPVMVLYQRATKWDQKTFQATLQPSFLVMNAASIATKGLGLDLPAPPIAPVPFYSLVMGATVVGLIAGELAAPHVSPAVAKKLAFAVACVGAVVTCIRGIVGMI
ncbi:MAG: sulfite exporter TauE/SafE family protein [Actinomycetaceae bacterium]|nr:sulfite exporter TauE/SafE family protein [Actinomycetaceae bacterium]MDU0969450.1 sulfite exporter TauE/SafE family protein [Actinomycetaceae bacterium]